MKISETIIAVLSDMHTGSSTALFPAGGYSGDDEEDNHVLPNEKQKAIHPVFTRFAAEVSIARKDKRLIVVMLGDAIDGFHHGSLQESLFKVRDQQAAHVSLMEEFLKKVSFKKGDELHYVKGTEAHVRDDEEQIAKDLGAVKTDNGTHVWNTLNLNINGTQHLFTHHGKKRGTGQNEGNALRNTLRDTRADRAKDGLHRLDALWSGHTHGHTWVTHIERTGGNFHEFHGIICPSWQAKTRYAYGAVPFAINSVGGVFMRVTVDGHILRPQFVVGVTKDR